MGIIHFSQKLDAFQSKEKILKENSIICIDSN